MGKSELVDTMVNDALWDATGFNMHMGMTAENVCTNETYQKKYGYSPISREQLDEFAFHSQEKAAKAIADGAQGRDRSRCHQRARRATPCLIPTKVPA